VVERGAVGAAPRAIVCDDAPGFRTLMSALLVDAGLAVVDLGETWADAERLAEHADAVVVDLWMPEFDAAALARVRAIAPAATLAVVTALPPSRAREQIGAIPVDLLLAKSAPPAEVAAAIARHVLER
jgi:CheY-like chemotaxis protein